MKYLGLAAITLGLIACASQSPANTYGSTATTVAVNVPVASPTPEPTVYAPAVPTACEKSGAFQPALPIQLGELPATTGKKFCPVIMRVPQDIVDWLEQGVKHYEYRKVFPTDPISHIVYFNTTTGKLVGYAPVGKTLVGPPRTISEMTWQKSGATLDELMGYFGETRPYGYATELKSYIKFKTEISGDDIRAKMDPDFQDPPKYTFVSRFPKLERFLKTKLKARP